jgi:hypothetical protein
MAGTTRKRQPRHRARATTFREKGRGLETRRTVGRWIGDSAPASAVVPDDATPAAIRELEERMTRTESISVDELMRRRAERGHPVTLPMTCHHGVKLWEHCTVCEGSS